MPAIYFLLAYLVIVNFVGFAMMGIDKWKAKKKKWRIPEAALFMISIIGGSIGTWGGMYAFRHKTKHWYFVVFMPLILVLQIALIVGLQFAPINFKFM